MERFGGARLFFYNLSTAGHALFDSLLLTFYVQFLLPAREKIEVGMVQFLPERIYLGVFTVLGGIMIFGRLVDAVADPLIASWSDRSRCGLGRRRVFLLSGCLPLAASTVLVFFPPVHETSWINAAYLAVIVAVFFFSYTMYVAPYNALIPELGHTEKERIGITTAQGYMALIGGAVVMIGGPFLLGAFLRSSTPVSAYQKTVLVLGGLGLLLLFASIPAVDEKRYSGAKPSTLALAESFRMTMKNGPFLIFLLANMCLWFIFNTVRSSALPIGERLMRTDVEMAGFNFVLLFAVAGLCFVLVYVLTRRLGKKAVMMMGLGSFTVLAVLIALTGIVPVDPVVWGLIVFALFGFPTAVLLVVPNVFISELCDYDYRMTGERREAMYFGVHGFFLKLNLGASAGLIAFFYTLFGKDIANPLGVRLAVIAAAAVSAIGLVVMSRYPETETRGRA